MTDTTNPVGNGNSYFPDAAMTLLVQQADNSAKWAYYNKMMELQTVPMTQIAKDQAAAQAAAQAATTALGSANLNLQQLLGAQNAVQAAAGLNLQQSLGNQNAIQSAAGLQSQEAMGAMNLVAGLRGPQNAFQQQAVMEGLNQSGLSNAIGAIAGTYNQGSLGRQYEPAQAATLGSLASDIYGAGGQTGQLSPAQIAMQQALGLSGQNPAGFAVQGAQNLQNQPYVSNSVLPYLNAQGQIANQTANWGMGMNLGQPTGVQISADQINSLGTQWGIDPKYVQGYVNANGSLPQSPGTLTQWNQLNGYQSPIDGSYTKGAPVAAVTGYNAASAANQTPINSGSALNTAHTAFNTQYTGGTIPPAPGSTSVPIGSQGPNQNVTSPVSGYPPAASGYGGMTFGAPNVASPNMGSTSVPIGSQGQIANVAHPVAGTGDTGYGTTTGNTSPPGTISASYYMPLGQSYNQSGTPHPTPPGTYAPGGTINNAYMHSLPNLNNIDVRNYNRLNDDTKSFLGSAYESAGYSKNDLNNSVTRGATPWTAPTVGSVA